MSKIGAKYSRSSDSEGSLITFEIGCRRCIYLKKIGKNTYGCTERVHLDDAPVIPVLKGHKTEDWNICNGDDYNRDNK